MIWDNRAKEITQFPLLNFSNDKSGQFDGKLQWGGRNTYAVKRLLNVDGQEETHFGLLYHTTVVIWYNPNIEVAKLNSGRWRTYTTKERINWALPHGWSLYQRNHAWFVGVPNSEEAADFFDGIMLDFRDNRIVPDYIRSGLIVG